MIIDAIYSGGKFTPLEPVAFAENERVTIEVEPLNKPNMSEEEVFQKMDEAKDYHEWYKWSLFLPQDDDGEYKIEEWLEESRRLTGDRNRS